MKYELEKKGDAVKLWHVPNIYMSTFIYLFIFSESPNETRTSKEDSKQIGKVLSIYLLNFLFNLLIVA